MATLATKKKRYSILGGIEYGFAFISVLVVLAQIILMVIDWFGGNI